MIETTGGEPALSLPHSSWWFVTCFSKQKDDLSQWRAYSGSNSGAGYALAFRAAGLLAPSRPLVQVNYDKALHTEVATNVAKATLRFIS
jgi:hypothetical protein